MGVVQLSHVRRGVDLGIIQTNHGSAAGVQRMRPGDGVVLYSPKTDYPDGDPLQRFTAIGTVSEGDAWQADEGHRHPWRRRVAWDDAAAQADIRPLLDVLEFSRGNPHWGGVMRRGNVELSEHDFRVIAEAMGSVLA